MKKIIYIAALLTAMCACKQETVVEETTVEIPDTIPTPKTVEEFMKQYEEIKCRSTYTRTSRAYGYDEEMEIFDLFDTAMFNNEMPDSIKNNPAYEKERKEISHRIDSLKNYQLRKYEYVTRSIDALVAKYRKCAPKCYLYSDNRKKSNERLKVSIALKDKTDSLTAKNENAYDVDDYPETFSYDESAGCSDVSRICRAIYRKRVIVKDKKEIDNASIEKRLTDYLGSEGFSTVPFEIKVDAGYNDERLRNLHIYMEDGQAVDVKGDHYYIPGSDGSEVADKRMKKLYDMLFYTMRNCTNKHEMIFEESYYGIGSSFSFKVEDKKTGNNQLAIYVSRDTGHGIHVLVTHSPKLLIPGDWTNIRSIHNGKAVYHPFD